MRLTAVVDGHEASDESTLRKNKERYSQKRKEEERCIKQEERGECACVKRCAKRQGAAKGTVDAYHTKGVWRERKV